MEGKLIRKHVKGDGRESVGAMKCLGYCMRKRMRKQSVREKKPDTHRCNWYTIKPHTDTEKAHIYRKSTQTHTDTHTSHTVIAIYTLGTCTPKKVSP